MRLLLLTAAAGFAQVSVVTLLARDPWASPALPVAVLAAWSVNRSSDQAWLAVMPPAVVLGVVSAMPVGLFLLALLPVTLAGSVVARHGRDGAGESERWVGVLWRLSRRPALPLRVSSDTPPPSRSGRDGCTSGRLPLRRLRSHCW